MSCLVVCGAHLSEFVASEQSSDCRRIICWMEPVVDGLRSKVTTLAG